MSFEVTVAALTVPTDVSALKSFKDDLNLAFSLESVLKAFLNTSLAQVPAASSKSSVAYTSPAASWNPEGGPVTFGLQGGASGTFEILTSGTLLSYTDGLDSPQQKDIPLPANKAYTRLTLSFNISATASGNYSNGAYGVKAALDTAVSYKIVFCKAFDPATTLATAIGQTFTSFVLPLHSKTLAQLSDGDFLQHEFDGSVHFSFGAYAGLDKVLYSGQGAADVLKTLGSPLATLSGATSPEVKANVALDFSIQYATTFEAVISKLGGAAQLHLFRAQKRSSSVALTADLNFDANTTASIATHFDDVETAIANKVAAVSAPAGDILGKALSTADAKLNIGKYVAEVNDKLTSWLNKGNGLKSNLQAAIETSASRTVLVGYTFDLSSTALDAAWKAAIGGDFIAAFATGAVTLDIGSGLEQEYRRKTSFSASFFNLWHWSSWSDFSANTTLIYAGNNVFHLVSKIGRNTQTDTMGALRGMDLYFSADADVAASGIASSVAIDLHIDLTAQGDKKAMQRMATLLGASGIGQNTQALARDLSAFANNAAKDAVAQLQITIPATAYGRIHFDPVSSASGTTAGSMNDAANWKAFADAADDLSAWPLRQMSTVSTSDLLSIKSYGGWEEFNDTTNGGTTPDRHHTGNTSIWPPQFPSYVDNGSRNLIAYSLVAGQNFMNFCEALNQLCAESSSDVDTPWDKLVKDMTSAVKLDTSIDFLRPTALALVRLCTTGSTVVTGPASPAIPVDHFAVTIAL